MEVGCSGQSVNCAASAASKQPRNRLICKTADAHCTPRTANSVRSRSKSRSKRFAAGCLSAARSRVSQLFWHHRCNSSAGSTAQCCSFSLQTPLPAIARHGLRMQLGRCTNKSTHSKHSITEKRLDICRMQQRDVAAWSGKLYTGLQSYFTVMYCEYTTCTEKIA